MYQYYLSWYDRLVDSSAVSHWLMTALDVKGILKDYHKNLLGENGPKWLAEQCIRNKREFSNELEYLDLNNYSSGRFLSVAKSIYYVEQLKNIPVNQNHPLLLELQNRSSFESSYDEHFLLGHKALQILIERAPNSGIDESWLNAILAIGGDPRVPNTHPNHQKWWSALDPILNTKVRGWLSRLDLRLFLEALENYSIKQGNVGMKRMFPARKLFLEGLLDKNLITGTRLYLTSGFDSFLRRNYKDEHLPNYSRITDGNISVIHIQLGESHMIEGSHSCKLWIYKTLSPTAIVFDFTKNWTTYSSLTAGLSDQMNKECSVSPLIDNITHHPPLLWHNRSIKALNKAGVDISGQDV